MTQLLALIILIADIIAIVECIQSKADSTKKIIWILLIFFLPLLGLILYYAVGRKDIA